MLTFKQLFFVSSNNNKFEEIKKILVNFNIKIKFCKIELVEIQSENSLEISIEKAKTAFKYLKQPLIIEDDGLFIKSLGGFPGQYSSFVYKTLGNKGIIKLLEEVKDREAEFKSIIVYISDSLLEVFEGISKGYISSDIRKGGWGFDPIFQPQGSSLTFGELANEKNYYSHRSIAIKRFAEWYKSISK